MTRTVSAPLDSTPLPPAARTIIQQEEQIHRRFLAAFQEELARTLDPRKAGAELNQLGEHLLDASKDDASSLLTELRLQESLVRRRARTPLPDSRQPYFAHLRILTERGQRDVLLGHQAWSMVKRDITIVDWRSSPIAFTYFHHREGDTYERDHEGRRLEGRLLVRRMVAFEDGELVGIHAPQGSFIRDEHGVWYRAKAFVREDESEAFGPWRPVPEPPEVVAALPLSARRDQLSALEPGAPAVTALLDTEQLSIVEQDDEQPLLVLGGAGSGKTTVALHRVAALCHRFPERYPPERVWVVVPEEGLRRLTQMLLAQLHIRSSRVWTFDQWIRDRGRRHLKDLPKKECDETPSAVSVFKRHPALLDVLDIYVDHLAEDMGQRLDHRLFARGEVARALRRARGPHLVARLRKVEQALLRQRAPADHRRLKKLFGKEIGKLQKVNQDRHALFGDRELMARVVERSRGDLGQRHLDALLRHTWLQFGERAEKTWAHVDASRRRAIDGRSLDEGTPDEIAGTVDTEDFAVLLHLQQLKVGRPKGWGGRWETCRHLLVDEAQELAPVELGILGRSLAQDASVTVAGDAAQQLDETTAFSSWSRVLGHLGMEGVEPIWLRTSYRCPAPIARFAHQLLADEAPTTPPRPVRDGPPVLLASRFHPREGEVLLLETLSRILELHPRARVACIARDARRAAQLFRIIEPHLEAELVLDGSFSFLPGLVVTDVARVKGLEFEVVVVPDATAGAYPPNPVARRALHVAATRAVHRLWVMWWGQRSGVLPR